MAKTKNHFSISSVSLLIGVLAVLVGVLSIIFVSQQSSAHESKKKLNWQKQVSKKECNAKGDPIINVEQKVINDADSGEAGNYWAYDTFQRQIKVWKVSDNSYCATVKYEGQFAGIAGQRSPGNTGVLTGNEKGEFEGGYRTDITGTLLIQPLLKTHGSLGTTDYQCDVNGNCPGAFDWSTKYFNTNTPGFTFNMSWWGWTYHNGKHVWVNAITGNSGDVI